MTEPKIQLLTFHGCPLADAARASLERAVAELGLSGFEEIDLLGPQTPDEMKAWGSPTILVDGMDVAGSSKGNGLGCRVYPGPDRVPAQDAIVEFVRKARSGGHR